MATRQRTLNDLDLEDYLKSLFDACVLGGGCAQGAVAGAARTYAARRLGGGGYPDLCDTQACQVPPAARRTSTP